MKKTLSLFNITALALTLLVSGCSASNEQKAEETPVPVATKEAAKPAETPKAKDEWQTNDIFTPVLTEEETQIFQKVSAGMIGCDNTPIALLATQEANGTNYCFLAYTEFVLEGFIMEPAYTLIYGNISSSGTAQPFGYEVIEPEAPKLKDKPSDPELVGGWTVFDSVSSYPATTEKCDAVMASALQSYSGVGSFVPYALLAERESESASYMVIGRGTTASANPLTSIYLFIFTEDSEGNCEVTDARILDIEKYAERLII